MDIDKLKVILLDYIQLVTEQARTNVYDNHTSKLKNARNMLHELEDMQYDKLVRKAGSY